MSTKEILSQEEIDVLLDNADTVAKTTKSASRDEVEPYDIYSPRAGMVEDAPDLTPLPEKVARGLQKGLDAPLPELLKVELAAAPSTIEFGEFIQTLETPSAIGLASIASMETPALVILDVPALRSLVSVLFGGDGSGSDESQPDLTPTEIRVAGRVLRHSFQILMQNFGPELDCQLQKVETNPSSVAIAPDGETFLQLVYDLALGDHGGKLIFALQLSALDKISASSTAGSEISDESTQWNDRLLLNTSKAYVKLQGRAAELQLTISEVLQLAPGDFIPVEIDRSVTVCAQDKPLWRGLLGVSGSMKAIHLLGPDDHALPVRKEITFQDY